MNAFEFGRTVFQLVKKAQQPAPPASPAPATAPTLDLQHTHDTLMAHDRTYRDRYTAASRPDSKIKHYTPAQILQRATAVGTYTDPNNMRPEQRAFKVKYNNQTPILDSTSVDMSAPWRPANAVSAPPLTPTPVANIASAAAPTQSPAPATVGRFPARRPPTQ